MIPSPSVDSLLMYAYAQKGVEHVELKIDMDGEIPSVLYSVKLEAGALLKWRALQKAESISNVIFRKAALLALKKAGAPLFIEKAIEGLARAYLPEKFAVEVKIVQ